MSDSETPSGLRKALNISPQKMLHIKLGTLYGLGGAAVSSVITICGMWYSTQAKIDAIKVKTDGISEDVAAMRQDLKPTTEHTAILWDEHERTAVWRANQTVPKDPHVR